MNKLYSIITIQNYLSGKLNADEMYRLEREALEDPFLQDAIDGFMDTEAISHNQLSLLQKRLEKRVVEQQEERNVLHFTWQRLAVASVAGTLLIVIGILFWMMNTPLKDTKSSSIKEVEVTLTPPVRLTVEEGNIEPLKGWQDYQHYLSTKHTDEIAGQEVDISFEVRSNEPFNIKIIATESDQAAKEALRLIQEGPKWKGESGKIKVLF